MESRAEIREVTRDVRSGKWLMTLAVDDCPVEDLRGNLRLTLKKWKDKRSNQANAFLWEMLGNIAKETGEDKWQIYLEMLRKYGRFTYVLIKPNALESLRENWREIEVIGNVEVNGTTATQVICYYGTSTMDTAEFSKFIDSIKAEMVAMDLQPPCSEDMRRAIESYEKYNAKR